MSSRPGLLRRVAALGCLLAALASVDCTPQQTQTARDVHDAVLPLKNLACIMNSVLSDPLELQRWCRLADEVLPAVRDLIGFRDAGRRAGAVWHANVEPADGGADASP